MIEALAVIIGRAGSKGLPGKNTALVAGEQMICHTIRHAKAAQAVTRIIVSTDDEGIAFAARAMDIKVIERPAELATDTASVGAAVHHAVQTIKATESIVVILYANVPVRPPDLIDSAVRMLRQTGADSVQSYVEVGKQHPDWACRLDHEQRVEAYTTSTPDRRQDLEPLFIPDGGVLAVTAESLRKASDDAPHTFLGTDRRGIKTEAGQVVDVDSAADLAVAEAHLIAQGDHSGERRTIAVVTGDRAEFGVLRSVMRAIHQHPQLDLVIHATGRMLDDQHMDELMEFVFDLTDKYGGTIPVEFVPMWNEHEAKAGTVYVTAEETADGKAASRGVMIASTRYVKQQ
jgi:N-acylneuraminate cytidylyltransferase